MEHDQQPPAASPSTQPPVSLEQLLANMDARMNNQQTVLAEVVKQLYALQQPQFPAAAPAVQDPQPNPLAPQLSSTLSKAVEKIKLPQYSGERDVEELDTWIFQLERYFQFYPTATDQQRIELAGMQLKGQAATWWRDVYKAPGSRPTTWREFTTAITAMFMPVNREQLARDRLANARQRDKDSVANYTTYMRRLFLSICSLSQGDMVHRYIYGLRKDLRKDVALADPHTFEEAAAVASRLEALTRNYNRSDTWAQTRNHTGPQPMELGAMNRSAGQGQKQTRAPYYTGKRDMSKVKCYNCGRTGHFKHNCPALKQATAEKPAAGNAQGRQQETPK